MSFSQRIITEVNQSKASGHFTLSLQTCNQEIAFYDFSEIMLTSAKIQVQRLCEINSHQISTRNLIMYKCLLTFVPNLAGVFIEEVFSSSTTTASEIPSTTWGSTCRSKSFEKCQKNFIGSLNVLYCDICKFKIYCFLFLLYWNVTN